MLYMHNINEIIYNKNKILYNAKGTLKDTHKAKSTVTE